MSATSTSKRKSCSECVKGKRKCGMELPRCARCAKKNISCAYPIRGSAPSEVVIPELEFPWLDNLFRDSSAIPWEGALQPQIDALSSSASTQDSSRSSHSIDQILPHASSSSTYVLTGVPKESTMSRAETDAALHRFKTWPEKWVKEGKAPFIHPRLYVNGMPTALQDAYAACAIYSTKTDQNSFVAFTVIESKANELIRSANQESWTPLDLLAAVQALLIFQFIRLFDGDIHQRAQAERAEPVLAAWTERMNGSTILERSYTHDTAPSWRSWIFAESLRRTSTMSIFLVGIYSLVKNGYCTQGAQVSANCFTAQKRLWDASGPLEWARAKASFDPFWVQKMDFDRIICQGNGDELDDFGMVMLITFKGQDMVNHWLATTNSEETSITDGDFYQSLAHLVRG